MDRLTVFEKRILTGSAHEPRNPELVRRLLELLRRGQCVSLVGEGGSGKTTILRQLMNPDLMRSYGVPPETFVISGVTGEDTATATPDTFWTELLLPQMARSLAPVDTQLSRDIVSLPDEMGMVQLAVGEIFFRIQKKSLRALIVWDDFDWVRENPALGLGFFAFLRSLAMTWQVTYLISGNEPIQRTLAWNARTSPFDNIFDIYTLSLGAGTKA